jgi:4-amino-4-deoxy-L-arabinose transferase-like glycosyltransferase
MDTTNRPGLPLGRPASLPGRLRALALGRADDAAWVRPALIGVLALTAVLYVWGLSRNGYANDFYAAAVLAGTQSWKAFFFGALDAGSYITVDKPPASLWLMALSGRLFGFSSLSMLLPEALLGVATVGLVADIVRRTAGSVAGLIAAVVMALTPVAVLMFRFNNPDALLTFLLVAAAWALVRSLQTGRTRWLLIAAAVVGLAFLTKYLQAYIVVPTFVLTYLLLGPRGWLRRIGELLAAAGVLIASSGWWVAIVTLIPAADRPFIGGSTDNSVLNLVLGYDGLSRLGSAFGGVAGGLAETLGGAVGGIGGGRGFGGGGAGFSGEPGLLRLFNTDLGGEISWLLPLSGVALLVGLWVHRRAPRTDLARAGYVLWGGWLLTHAIVFSFAGGILHSYYTIAMAPGVAGLVGAGLVDLWRLRGQTYWAGPIAAVAVLGTAWWGHQLLDRSPSFAPGLSTLELALAVVAAVALVLPRSVLSRVPRYAARVPATALAVGLVAVLLGPAAYAVDTVGHAEQGATPSSGPGVTSGFGGPGGGGPGRLGAGAGGPGGLRFTRNGGGPPAGFDFTSPNGFTPPRGAAPPGSGGFQGGFDGGDARDGGTTNSTLISYLEHNQGSATWLVAVSSSMEAAPIELSTGKPVIAMGGFSGGDPAMTVAKLQSLVASGQLRYVLVGGNGGGPGGGNRDVTDWITQHGTQVSSSAAGVSGLYDLRGATSGS